MTIGAAENWTSKPPSGPAMTPPGESGTVDDGGVEAVAPGR